ncbi:hypothetical protein HDV00_008820 [Rhizophlyctis rosea]|nr:hypothetical protein HDV00_008820 [Rhizophlyctis rosea]
MKTEDQTTPNPFNLTIFVPALGLSFIVPTNKLKDKSSYFDNFFSVHSASGNPFPTTIEINPPAPHHFSECLVGDLVKINKTSASDCMGIYRNADFLGMDSIINACCKRFDTLHDALETVPEFTHEYISFDHLVKIIRPMADDLIKLRTLLVWGRGITTNLQARVKQVFCPNPGSQWKLSASLKPRALAGLLHMYPQYELLVPVSLVAKSLDEAVAVPSGRTSYW